ncbi:MAG: transposase [Candidatus Scalinduaceae bacterium]
MNFKYKKRIRLKHFDYKDNYRYFVTLCTYNKMLVFTNKSKVSWLINVLRKQSKTSSFRIWAYCFMPDHLHLLTEGVDSDSDMKKFISSYKQCTGFHYKKETGLRLWQINYYEHVLRREEETTALARYISANPVRKGIVEDFAQYELLGSFEFNINET